MHVPQNDRKSQDGNIWLKLDSHFQIRTNYCFHVTITERETRQEEWSHSIFFNTQFSIVKTEALQFGLQFATGVNNARIVNLISFNYRYNSSDFNKEFM